MAGGATGYQTYAHMKKEIEKKGFRCSLKDVTDKLAVLSIQGPKSGEILQAMTETPITDEQFPIAMSKLVNIAGQTCRALRISFVGELGYEIHMPTDNCEKVYQKIKEVGRDFGMKNAGFKALYSLSLEKGKAILRVGMS